MIDHLQGEACRNAHNAGCLELVLQVHCANENVHQLRRVGLKDDEDDGPARR